MIIWTRLRYTVGTPATTPSTVRWDSTPLGVWRSTECGSLPELARSWGAATEEQRLVLTTVFGFEVWLIMENRNNDRPKGNT